MVVRRSAVAAARQINLNQKKLKREAEQVAKLDLWCTEHDGDGNGEFDRDELRTLLNALHPQQPVEDSMLDELLERATGVYTSSLTLRGDKNGRVTKKALFKTVSQYDSYIKDQKRLDALFDRFDTDRSGQLDTAELLEMMRASCSDDEAMRKQVGEGDVAFVLEHCDTDGDKKIARDEVLPMLAIWRELVEDIKERHVSSGNLLGADGKQPGAKASKSSSISCALL
uniref:EF-hand domain-containing protein n=1 Tax=Phaeocystis antarctica TaxID=33657 RepID=A0A7S0DYV2_9EUKA|mmetsp:Transcript_58886/g.141258  ORF Transcript_58886/g.141258 Transcript_58886/m.141258 type:complete len:227 (-) Transcript_58886:158-838(-)